MWHGREEREDKEEGEEMERNIGPDGTVRAGASSVFIHL